MQLAAHRSYRDEAAQSRMKTMRARSCDCRYDLAAVTAGPVGTQRGITTRREAPKEIC
jgi:hypothetical protein